MLKEIVNVGVEDSIRLPITLINHLASLAVLGITVALGGSVGKVFDLELTSLFQPFLVHYIRIKLCINFVYVRIKCQLLLMAGVSTAT